MEEQSKDTNRLKKQHKLEGGGAKFTEHWYNNMKNLGKLRTLSASRWLRQ